MGYLHINHGKGGGRTSPRAFNDETLGSEPE